VGRATVVAAPIEGVVVTSPLLPVIGRGHWNAGQPMIQSKLFHRLMNRLYEYD
jgi:hypothetical protein